MRWHESDAWTRRRFLAAAAALPALGGLSALPTFAAEVRRDPPYLSLEPLIVPGDRDFPEERLAVQTVAALHNAVRVRALPLAETFAGSSPNPARFRDLSADLRQSEFEPGDTDVQAGWVLWLDTLGSIRRIDFYALADGLVRYEAAGAHDGKLIYRVGQWKQQWREGKLTSFSPVEEFTCRADRPFFRDVTGGVFAQSPSFSRQLAYGIPYWRARLDPATGIDIYGSNGIAVGDIDGDGNDEIYVCQPGGLPNRLYR